MPGISGGEGVVLGSVLLRPCLCEKVPIGVQRPSHFVPQSWETHLKLTKGLCSLGRRVGHSGEVRDHFCFPGQERGVPTAALPFLLRYYLYQILRLFL